MDLFFEERYAHSIERVWTAITSAEALSQWLMPNDFKPEVGRKSVFRFCAPDDAAETLVHVTVERLEPPRFMSWRWRGADDELDSTVTFELESREGGTLLRLWHTGELPPFRTDQLRKGWPSKLAALQRALGA